MGYLQLHPEHSLHAVAAKEAIYSSNDVLVDQIMSSLTPETIPAFFELLLEQRARTVGWWHGKAWCRLLSLAADEKQLNQWFDRMADVAARHLSDLSEIVKEWLPDRTFANRLVALLPDDLAAMQWACRLDGKRASDPVFTSAATVLSGIIGRVCLPGTLDRLRNVLSQNPSTFARLDDLIADRRRQIFADKKQAIGHDQETDLDSADWVYGQMNQS